MSEPIMVSHMGAGLKFVAPPKADEPPSGLCLMIGGSGLEE